MIMKKVYLSLFSFAFVCGVNSQTISKMNYPVAGKKSSISTEQVKPTVMNQEKGATLFSWDFSDPTLWAVDNTSTPAVDWSITTDANLVPVTALKPAAFTSVANGYALIDSDSEGAAGIQNCNLTLTTPFSTLGNPNVSIVFENSYRTYLDTRLVRVSNDGGTTWTDFVVTDGTEITGINTANPKSTSVNISSVAGNQASVLIQFNYQAAWGWYWAIDDVKITVTDNYDLEIQETLLGVDGAWGARLAYYQTPTTQVQPIIFGAKCQNMGIFDQTDAVYTATIASASFVGTSIDYALTSSQIDTLYAVQTFTPAATVANYSVVSAVNSATNSSLENDLANNQLAPISMDVTSKIYARDKGVLNSGSYNQGLAFEVGNIFDIFADETLYSIDVVLSAGAAVDAVMYGTLYSIDATTGDFIFVDKTDDHAIVAGEPGTKVTLSFGAPSALTAATPYLITVGSGGGPGDDLIVGTSGISPKQTSFYLDETGTWFYTTSTPMVRMNFLNDLGLNEIENTFGLSVYPNPANGQANVSFKLNTETQVVISITDLAGKVAYTNNLGTTVSGAHNVAINTDALSNGVYMVNVLANGVVSTQKLIVRK